jgi:hypothetical protein
MISRLKTIVLPLLCCLLSGSGWAASAPTEKKPAIPPDLYSEFEPIPDDQNAIIQWRRADAFVVPLGGNDLPILAYCWTPGARQPASEDMARLQNWVRQNRQALDLFNDSLKMAKAQWPERDPQKTQPELRAFRNLTHARLFEANQMVGEKNFDAAAGLLEGNLKLADDGLAGGPRSLGYLTCCSIRSMTGNAILRLAANKEVPLKTLGELLDHLPPLDGEITIYSNVTSADFTESYQGKIDVNKTVATWSKYSQTNSILFYLFPTNLVKPAKILLDPSLVALHPKPFDLNAAIEQDIYYDRIYRTNTLTVYTKRNNELEMRRAEDREDLLEEIGPLMDLLKDEPLPLSRQAAQRARTAYLAINDPVGRIFHCSILSFGESDIKVCQSRTEREAARCCLALIIFEREKGQLPPDLKALVQEKILPALPVDFFCGLPLNYSRDGHKIWSVNFDGVDDDGTAGKTLWGGKDAVWQIPELN